MAVSQISLNSWTKHVHLKKGKAETLLAKALWHKGFRYRLNYKALPGSPDIALTKQRIAVFVDGEFLARIQLGRAKSKTEIKSRLLDCED